MRKHIMLGVPVLIAVLAGSAVGVNATDDTDPDDTGPDGLVTEEVEPDVERIISDGAGHDLDETHPDFHYDMDDIAIMPDGAHGGPATTNRQRRQPTGWTPVGARGEPGETTTPEPSVFCTSPIPISGCLLRSCRGDEISYLAGVRINDSPSRRTAPPGPWASMTAKTALCITSLRAFPQTPPRLPLTNH